MEAAVQWIVEGNYVIVAFQFPEDMLGECVEMIEKMEQSLHDAGHSAQLHILADSAYDSASVDSIAAEHVHADCLIHFGDASLSKQSQIPTFYVFHGGDIDLNGLSNLKAEILNVMEDRPVPVVVFIDASLDRQQSTIMKHLSTEGDLTLQLAQLQTETTDHQTFEPTDVQPSLKGLFKFLMDGMEIHEIGGYVWQSMKDEPVDRTLCLWMGHPRAKALMQLQLHLAPSQWITFDHHGLQPEVESILKRRAFLVKKAREAQIVGILISTFGVEGILDTVNKVKQLALSVGKHVYEIVVAKPNPAKLANFPEVDVFVSVCDPYAMILNCKEFLAPLITPFEAYTAWTGTYLSHRQYRYHLPTDFHYPESTRAHTEDTPSQSLAVRQKRDIISTEESPAESFFRRREFHGLKPEHPQEQSSIHEGSSGTASGYSHEPTV